MNLCGVVCAIARLTQQELSDNCQQLLHSVKQFDPNNITPKDLMMPSQLKKSLVTLRTSLQQSATLDRNTDESHFLTKQPSTKQIKQSLRNLSKDIESVTRSLDSVRAHNLTAVGRSPLVRGRHKPRSYLKIEQDEERLLLNVSSRGLETRQTTILPYLIN